MCMVEVRECVNLMCITGQYWVPQTLAEPFLRGGAYNREITVAIGLSYTVEKLLISDFQIRVHLCTVCMGILRPNWGIYCMSMW